MKQFLPLVLCVLILLSCNQTTEKKTAEAAPTIKKQSLASLECTTEGIEAPNGEIISQWKNDNQQETYKKIDYAQDSLYLYTYIMADSTNQYQFVEVLAMAYNDIDPPSLETAEYDIELTNGGKEHQTVFYIKSKSESPVFRNVIYTCLEGDNHFEQYPIHTVNSTCSTLALAKEQVEKIKAKLPTTK